MKSFATHRCLLTGERSTSYICPWTVKMYKRLAQSEPFHRRLAVPHRKNVQFECTTVSTNCISANRLPRPARRCSIFKFEFQKLAGVDFLHGGLQISSERSEPDGLWTPVPP